MGIPNRDSLQELRLLNDGFPNVTKFFLPFCQYKIDQNPELSTDEWLVAKKILKNKVAIQGLLNAAGFNDEYVVVKVGNTEDIEKEFLRSRLLFANNLLGFLPYICMFKCNDDPKMYVTTQENILLDKGFCRKTNQTNQTMSAIVMPFLKEKSVEENMIQNTIDFSIVIHCLKMLIILLQEAFEKVGFIHRDMHWNNVFIKYKENIPLIIDYGDSLFIPRGYTQQTTDKLMFPFAYHAMHYNDFLKLLSELGDIYRNKQYLVDGSTDLIKYIETAIKNSHLIDIAFVIKRIESFQLVPY